MKSCSACDSNLTGPIYLYVREFSLDVYLIDGTYELFRHYYALPSANDADGREVAAVRGVLHRRRQEVNHPPHAAEKTE